jgi:hypothetical protein
MMKRKLQILGMVVIVSTALTFAQTARVQVIHNSADAVADSVDVYLNDGLLLDNFAFRNATPFIDAPAGSPISIDIAPKGSGSSAESIYNLTTTLTTDEKYVLVASGIVSGSGYSPLTPFGIDVFAMGMESAGVDTTALLVYHGTTDAPEVDIYEATGPAELAGNVEYGEFAGYLELPTADYYLQIRDNSGTTSLEAYDAPLATLQLGGGAGVVVASGFLDPSVNSNGPEFGLYVALASGGEMIPLPESMARVQVIHNSADAIADSVDVYLDDELLLDNFAFRDATPFIDAPAGVEISIDIAPKGSSSSAESIYNLSATLASEETYVLVATGIVSGSGYSPAEPFSIEVFDMGREAASNGSNTDLVVFHGSTDATPVDVYEATGPAELAGNVAYGDFAGYLELPTADYYLQVRDSSGLTSLFAYDAPLAGLSLQGGAGVVVASGFVDPSANSDGPDFGLFVALPSGGDMVALPVSMARVQVIHNSADAIADSVDVYLNKGLLIDNFAFRNATSFIDAPAGTEISIDVAPKSSMSAEESIYNMKATLMSGETYILAARGIVSGSGYSPAPAFGIDVFAMGLEEASMGSNTDVLVYHGSTDAPTVDVIEASGPSELIDDLEYAAFAEDYLALPTADYVIEVRDETGSSTVQAYSAPLSTLSLDGAAITVVASGFLDPSSNSDGAAFGLYVALADGGEMLELPIAEETPTGLFDRMVSDNLTIYPNPAVSYVTVSADDAFDGTSSLRIYSSDGKVMDIINPESGNEIRIDLAKYDVGVYYITYVVNETVMTSKFLKVN